MTTRLTIYCNRKPVTGPWGGGNRILQSFINEARAAGHDVIFSLSDAFRDDARVDVIFCMDPRQGATSDELSHDAIMAIFPNASQRPFIVQRVGDIGTHGKPELRNLVIRTTPVSDFVIFPSEWCSTMVNDSLFKLGKMMNDYAVIWNSPNPAFFAHRRVSRPIPQKNIRFVTHHWSMNPKKGFAFYNELDAWCKNNGHTFTFYGRAPDTATFTSSGVLDVDELARSLPMHDVYVTASEEEAGANHVLEALSCGLPILFHEDGGSIPEYVRNCGESFNDDFKSFETALLTLANRVNAGNFPVYNIRKSAGQSLVELIEKYV